MATQQQNRHEKREVLEERKSEQCSKPIHHDHYAVIRTSINRIESKDCKEEDVKTDDGSGDVGKCAGVLQQAEHFRCICED
jgi:hypothetical protein